MQERAHQLVAIAEVVVDGAYGDARPRRDRLQARRREPAFGEDGLRGVEDGAGRSLPEAGRGAGERACQKMNRYSSDDIAITDRDTELNKVSRTLCEKV
jgi:hypothetical protein